MNYYLPMNTFNVNLSELQWTHSPKLIGHLMAVTYFIQRKAMDKLAGSRGYPSLSLAYEGYIALMADQDRSPGELAAQLGISKQACSKTVGEMEKMGLIERRRNPEDSRSSLLSLTAKGHQLIEDGIEASTEIQQQFADILGIDALEKLIAVLETVCHKLSISIPTYRAPESVNGPADGRRPTRLILLLPKLSEYLYQAMITSLSTKGFKGLKSNFSQVLSLIIPNGGRIQTIAAVVGVSKQAIAAIAAELEQLGYIVRESDPNDRRQVILRLSPLGAELMNASETSLRTLEASLKDILGDDFLHLETAVATLFFQALDHHNTPSVLPRKIRQLSEDLLAELGVAGARALAQQLMTITRGES